MHNNGTPGDFRALETRYKGHRFRSRHDARWYVFSEACGETWDYESEGYFLGDLGCYLPDFYWHRHKCLIEIKPNIPEPNFMLDDIERKMLVCFQYSEEARRGVVFWGLPSPSVRATLFEKFPGTDEVYYRRVEGGLDYFFDKCPQCGHAYYERIGAIEAARSARFEHGESGLHLVNGANRGTPSIHSKVLPDCGSCGPRRSSLTPIGALLNAYGHRLIENYSPPPAELVVVPSRQSVYSPLEPDMHKWTNGRLSHRDFAAYGSLRIWETIYPYSSGEGGFFTVRAYVWRQMQSEQWSESITICSRVYEFIDESEANMDLHRHVAYPALMLDAQRRGYIPGLPEPIPARENEIEWSGYLQRQADGRILGEKVAC